MTMRARRKRQENVHQATTVLGVPLLPAWLPVPCTISVLNVVRNPLNVKVTNEKENKLLVFLSAYCYTIAIVLTVTLRRRPILNFGPPSTNLTLRIVKYDHSHILNRLN